MNTKIINKKIVNQSIVKQELPKPIELPEMPDIISGVTYKVQGQEHATYVTINHTEKDGKLVPFQVFINSKDPKLASPIQIIGRLVSALLRVNSSIPFIVEELKAVHEPSGGYWCKGTFHVSFAAHIGHILEKRYKELN